MTSLSIIGYTLAAMFSVGCVVLPISVLVDRWRAGDYAVAAFFLLIGVPAGFGIACVPWAIIADIHSPTLAVLHKGEWVCTQKHIENGTMPVSTGKTVTMVPTVRSVCDQYSRTVDYD